MVLKNIPWNDIKSVHLSKVCPVCNGKGWLVDPKNGARRICPHCRGRGRIF